MEVLGKHIKYLIKSKGFTISEFAERIHVSRRFMYDLFKRNNIDTDLLIRISDELGENLLDYVQLFAQQKDKNEKPEKKDIKINELGHIHTFSIPETNKSKIKLQHANISKILLDLKLAESKIEDIKDLLDSIKQQLQKMQ